MPGLEVENSGIWEQTTRSTYQRARPEQQGRCPENLPHQ